MSALALMMSAGSSAATSGLPYFHLGALDIGIPIQWFGMIVAAGVLIGATPLRRYAEWHGVSDDHIRGLLTWVMVSGFLGAHEFDVIAYQWERIGDGTVVPPAAWWPLGHALWPSNWPLVIRFWDGISSYGGFVGGGIGFALYVWWKRLPARLFADITIVGLLPAFSIGRIGCTVVSDHIGAAIDPNSWFAFLGMDYPRSAAIQMVKDASGQLSSHVVNATLADLFHAHDVANPGTVVDHLLAWNLGLIEFLYLVPVNVVILYLAFRASKRSPAGFLTVLTGVLYAPVRFLLDFLRPEDTDPRYGGLTFAQWASILAFGVALYAANRILKTGAAAETVTRTSREAQERLKIILRGDEEAHKQHEADKKAEEQAEAARKKAEVERLRAERDREDAELEAAERAKAALAVKQPAVAVAGGEGEAGGGDEDGGGGGDEDDDADDAAESGAAAEPAAAMSAASASASKPAAKPGGGKPGGGKPGGGKSGAKKAKSRKR